MQAIKCELCGSNQLIKKDGYYQCEHCGTKYTLEEAKKLIVTGTVEVVSGNAEKERLLNNAETFYNIGEIEKALLLYKDIQNKFPEEPRGWEGTLTVIVNKGVCISESKSYGVPYYYLNKNIEKINIEFDRVFNAYRTVSKKTKDRQFFINIFTKNYLNGLFDCGISEVLLPEDVINEGKTNANLVNELRLIEHLTDNNYLEYAKCIFCYGKLLLCKTDSGEFNLKTKNVISTEYLNNIKTFRINNGLCLFCGGKFKGIINKVCTKCGALKNY